MKLLDTIALTLLIIGGLHLLIVGIFDYNVITTLFTSTPIISRVIHILIGLSALWCIKYYGYTPKGGSRLKDR